MTRIIFAALAVLCFSQASLAAPPLEAYGRLPGVEMLELSPSGERYAVIGAVAEARRFVVLSTKGEVLISGELGNTKVRKIQWIGDDRVLIWWSTTFDHPLDFKQAYELSTVLNVDLKAHKATPIFASTRKVANLVCGFAGTARVRDHDYGYFVGLTYELSASKTEYEFHTDHRDLYQVDLESGDVTLLARGGTGPSYYWVVGADGAVIAHSEYNKKDGIWRLYAGENRAKLLLEKSDPMGDFWLIDQGRTPGTVFIEDNSSGAATTLEISVADGKSTPLFVDQPVDEYILDPDSGAIIGATTLTDPRAVFFNPKLQARINGTRKAFPNLRMEPISFGRNLDRLIVKTDGGDDSGTYWLVDITTGNADPIGRPYPEIRATDVGPTHWITYKAGDGLEIGAVLTLPPGLKPEKLPLVVLPHGGPIGVSDAAGFDWWAQAFASAGYAVLQPNYRGSGGNGKDFVMAGYGQMGRKMQTDLSDGVAALSAQGVINPQRVCIVGASYGGYAALAGVTLQHDIYRCAVSVAGVSDLPTFFHWTTERFGYESDASRHWRSVVGTDKGDDSLMASLSPSHFARQASAPILLIHGKDDTVVPIQQSERMESALRDAKKSVQVVEMSGEDHWLSRDETRKTMLKAAVTFVREHNPAE